MSSVNEGFVPIHCSGELFLECPEISEISSGFFLVVMVRAHLAQPCMMQRVCSLQIENALCFLKSHRKIAWATWF